MKLVIWGGKISYTRTCLARNCESLRNIPKSVNGVIFILRQISTNCSIPSDSSTKKSITSPIEVLVQISITSKALARSAGGIYQVLAIAGVKFLSMSIEPAKDVLVLTMAVRTWSNLKIWRKNLKIAHAFEYSYETLRSKFFEYGIFNF